ncbi:MAG: hypothetical protein RL286_806, partial [Bacteroidota bacterium]
PVIIEFYFKKLGSVVQGKICRVVRVVGEVVVAYDCYFECFTHVGVLVQHWLAFEPTSKLSVGYL